jgi:hypothetical protein
LLIISSKIGVSRFFSIPLLIAFQAAAAALSRAPTAPKGTLYSQPPSASEGTAKATIDKKGG